MQAGAVHEFDPAAYGDAWSGAYDRLYGTRDDPATVIAALERLGAGRDILDFGLGTGRLAIPLAAAGYNVAGIEASPAMVDAFRNKPGTDSIEVVIGDFVTSRLGRRFDVVFIAFSTLFLLPDQDTQVECLSAAAAHLRPGGALFVEAFVPDHSRWDNGRRLALSRWDEAGVEIEAARHDRAIQTIQVRYVQLAPEGITERPLELRYAWPSEIDLMARAAGLRLADRWADWAATPFGPTSDGHVSVYRFADGR
jgi:SAM-dependent methyltransferase